jgi:pilus assembly protein CpaC
MARTSTLRAACLAALVAIAGVGLLGPATASGPRAPVIRLAAGDTASRFVPLGIGKSVVIDVPRDIKDVLVADPKIANAVVRSSRRVYLIGVKVGQTNVFLFDSQGRQIAGFDIAVKRDLNGLRAALKAQFPNADIQIEGVGDGVMLSGWANSQSEAQQAFDLATRLAGSESKVVNGITVRARDQVMLKVTVAEVQRDVVKQLGIDLSGSLSNGTAVLNFNTDNPFSASGNPLTNTNITGNFSSITATLRAMERAGVIRTLAEPTLTAISGESAQFLAGGEFPYPIPTSSNPPTIGIEFKKFGVSLTFTPVVLSEGRISLKVLTEVSELSNEGGVTIQGTTVPSLQVRRADTTVEIPSGGALALAGMIQEQTKQAINGLPGLMKLPILGTLFKSRDYLNHQSELMVIVTPYIVHAVARKDLSRPDDGFADASDPASILLGRLNRIYGVAGKVHPHKAYYGKYGFILD